MCVEKAKCKHSKILFLLKDDRVIGGFLFSALWFKSSHTHTTHHTHTQTHTHTHGQRGDHRVKVLNSKQIIIPFLT